MRASYWEYVIQYLPLLLVLACPLMHLLHRHGGRHAHRDSRANGKEQ